MVIAMNKRFLYSVATGQVLQWQDTELWNYADAPEGTAIEAPTVDEWNNREALSWFIGGALTDIAPVFDPPKPTKEQAAIIGLAKQADLLVRAAVAMGPLQDAVDLNDATANEKSALATWKYYRVALNRVQEQPGFPLKIDWPVTPLNDTRPTPQT